MALVDPSGVVVGLLDWDTAQTFTPPPGYTLHATADAKVGDVWAAGAYIPSGAAADNRALLLAKGRAYLALTAPTALQTQRAVRALVLLAVDELGDVSGT